MLSQPKFGIVRLNEGKQSDGCASSNTTTRLFAQFREEEKTHNSTERHTRSSNVRLLSEVSTRLDPCGLTFTATLA